MADIDTVLERLVTDADFRARLGTDPAGALAGYDLDADDLALLASSLDEGDQGGRGVEQRTSKSALVGLLASLGGGSGGPAAGGDATGDPSTTSAPSGNQAGKWPMDVQFRQRFESQEPAVDDLAAPEDQGGDARKLPGRPKVGDITLKRGATGAPAPDVAAPDLTDADAGEPVPEYSFKQGWPSKWQGAAAEDGDAGDDLAAPGDPGEDAGKLPGKPKAGEITLKRGSGSLADPGAPAVDDGGPADVAAPGAAPAEQEVRRYDITGAWPKSAPPEEDFLTIEDE